MANDIQTAVKTKYGEIATSGPRDASVVVAALGGDGFVIETAVATGASHDLRAAGAHVARCLPTPDGKRLGCLVEVPRADVWLVDDFDKAR